MGGSNSVEINGLRVFKVMPGSPAFEAGLEVYFDFILELNGKIMDQSGQDQFAKLIAEADNKTAKLQVFNTRMNAVREVNVNPRKWSENPGLLGATVRYDVVDPADNHGMRVLEVFPNSPAAHAGLMPFQDYLLGTPQSVFHDIDELAEHLNVSINKRLQIYVYNVDYEQVREVTIVPNNEWGGDGCIGCDIGTGLLHRIPVPRNNPARLTQQMVPPAVTQLSPAPAIPMQPQAAYAPQVPFAIPPMTTPAIPPAVPPAFQAPAATQPAMTPGVYQAIPPYTMPGAVHPATYQTVPSATIPVPGTAQVLAPTPVGEVPANFAYPHAPGNLPTTAYQTPLVPTPQPAFPPAPPTVPTPVPTVPCAVPNSTPTSDPPPSQSQTSIAPSASLQAPATAVPTIPTPALEPAIPQAAPPTGLSPQEELAALQARIQQLGATMTVPVPPVPVTAPVS